VLRPYAKGLVIATKGGLTRSGPGVWEPVARAPYLKQCVEMSLRRLKLECIDLYQLHRFDPKTPREETLGALRKMQEQGKIRHIGLSEVSVEDIKEARKHVTVVSVQNLYNLGDRSPVMLPIPGTSSVKHLEENTAAASLQLSAAEWQEIERSAG
jgi:aryl-alcohol dehydrogenase-like predicted oxidoreductase